MDPSSEFRQISIAPKDRDKTELITYCGTYAIRKILLGQKKTPAMYQTGIDRILTT